MTGDNEVASTREGQTCLEFQADISPTRTGRFKGVHQGADRGRRWLQSQADGTSFGAINNVCTRAVSVKIATTQFKRHGAARVASRNKGMDSVQSACDERAVTGDQHAMVFSGQCWRANNNQAVNELIGRRNKSRQRRMHEAVKEGDE